MAYLAYLTHSDNEIVGVTPTPSSEDSSYPVTNVDDPLISKTFRFTGDTDENLLYDFSTAKSIGICALVNHNLSENAIITLMAGTTSGVSDFSVVIPYREFTAWKYLSTPQSYRYWKVRIQDSGNADGFIEIGYLMIGPGTELAFNFLYGWKQVDHQENFEDITEFGAEEVAEGFEYVELTLPFSISASEASTLRDLWKTLKRNLTPLLLIPDWEGLDAYFGRITSQMGREFGLRDTNSELVFKTSAKGRSIGA